MVKRYNIDLNVWEIGFWQDNVTFKVVAMMRI